MDTAWTITANGKRIYLNPQKFALNEYSIEDIAHALARLPRFNGHTTRHYSVARHCVFCSLVVSPRYAFAALLHDAAEAYVGDFPGPFMQLVPDLAKAINALQQNIEKHFSVPQSDASARQVKWADRLALNAEAQLLLTHNAWATAPSRGLPEFSFMDWSKDIYTILNTPYSFEWDQHIFKRAFYLTQAREREKLLVPFGPKNGQERLQLSYT